MFSFITFEIEFQNKAIFLFKIKRKNSNQFHHIICCVKKQKSTNVKLKGDEPFS